MKINYEDMSGDRVYDYLKSITLEDIELVGAIISEPKVVTHFQPRKVITVKIKTKEGEELFQSFNYKKIERDILSKEKYGR
jgi:hypothetical protein